MLPGLMQAIAAGADPNHALNRLSDIVERLSSGVNLFRLLEARPPLARLLAKILAHAPALAEQLARRPELFEGLFDASSFAMPPAAAEFAELLSGAMRGQPYDVALDRARRMVNERRFALGVQLIDRHRDPLEVADGLCPTSPKGRWSRSARPPVAEFEQAHGRFPGGELMVLGLGRLGGCALTHASDLDLIYLHTAPADGMSDGDKPLGPNDYFNRLASRVTAALSVPTAAGPLYDVDTRLRPEGATGMLIVSLDAFEQYQRDHAWTWEHMALCRARPLFGSAAMHETRGRDRRRHPAHAARPVKGRRATRSRCGPRWSATSRPQGRSTSSSARAGWSTSSSPSTSSSSRTMSASTRGSRSRSRARGRRT